MAPFGASRAGLMSVAEDDIPDSVVDNFERGNLDPYIESGGGSFSVQQSIVWDDRFESAYALAGTHDDDHNIYSGVGDGLENYPERGDEIRLYTYIDDALGDSRFGFGFGASSDPGASRDEGYIAYITTTESPQELFLRKEDSDLEQSGAISPPDEEWFEWRIEWTDPTITVSLHENWDEESEEFTDKITSISADDDEFDSGGIYFYLNHSGTQTTYFDQCWVWERGI